MAPFYWDIKYFATVEKFDAYTQTIGRQAFLWVKKAVVHHTYIPTQKQWKGRASMLGLANYYRGLGWNSGPQLFIEKNGIWQGTPVFMRGIHAGLCNPHTIGLEFVGNYDLEEWPAEIQHFGLGALNSIYKITGLPINSNTLVGHRDCNSPKTCPGKKINIGGVIKALQNKPKPYQVLGDGLRLRTSPYILDDNIVENITFNRSDIFYGIKETEGDLVFDQNVWVQHESQRGFASKHWLKELINGN